METCKNCKSKFEVWTYEYVCQHCEDGIAETTRDIDFNGTGYNICHVCKESGLQSKKEDEFCCECCMDEYMDEICG